MKKKIINGFLMVALLAATVTSFVSCKDNDEDVKTDLIAQLQKKSTDLTNAYIAADQALNSALTTAYQNADDALKTQLQNWVEAKDYATKQWVNDQDYATKTWVEAQGYLKEADFANTLYNDPKFAQLMKDLYGADGTSGLSKDVANLLDKINDEEAGIDAINENIDDINDEIDDINDRLEDIEKAIEEIQEDFKNLITSVNVNATSTSLLANSKIFPGLNVQFVGAAFGKAAAATGTFPSADADLNGNKLPEAYIAEEAKDFYTWEGGIINNEDNNAGKVYFTVNPSNVSENVLNNTVKLSLTNSNNDEEIVTLSNVQKANKVLSWGTTRGDSKVTLFEADATYDLSDENIKAIDPTQIIDFKSIAGDFKDIINSVKGISYTVDGQKDQLKETTKAAAKTTIKESAKIVATLLNGKLPSLPALALKAEWTDNTVGTRNVISDYSLAATAYKPLSFAFGKVDGEVLPNISLDRLESAVHKVTHKINKELKKLDKKLNIQISKITYDASSFKVNETAVLYYHVEEVLDDDGITAVSVVDQIQLNGDDPRSPGNGWASAGTFTVSKNFKDDIDDIIKAVNKGIPTKKIDELIAEAQNYINKAQKWTDFADDQAEVIINYLENQINRVINLVNNGGVARALEPILLSNGTQGVRRAAGAYKAGKITFIPTTVTYEVVAPAFKKYVAVIDKNGKVREYKTLTKGDDNFSQVELTLEAGDTKLVYAAMDFTGRQINKVYDITVE
jgi:hypothetical protein